MESFAIVYITAKNMPTILLFLKHYLAFLH